MLSGSSYCSIEFRSDDFTGSHGIITGSNDTTYIIRSINICITHAVLYSSLHTPCDGTDLTLFFVIPNDNTLFDGAIFNRCYKCGRTTSIRIGSLICSNKTGL